MFRRYYSIFLIINFIFFFIPDYLTKYDGITGNKGFNNEIFGNYISYSNDLFNEIHVDISCIDDKYGSEIKPADKLSKTLNFSLNPSKVNIHDEFYKENNLNIIKYLDINSKGNVSIDAENSSKFFTINTTFDDEARLLGITFINGRAYQDGAINAPILFNGRDVYKK